MNEIKKFLSKHSFIVIFAVAIIIAAANFLVYPVFIKGSMNYKDVPVAKVTLPEGTQIADEMIAYVSVTAENVPQGAMLNKEDVVGKFVKENNSIPTNGYFYVEQVANDQQTFGSVYKELEEGEWAYTLVVPARYCQNGAFKIKQLIDIYFYTEVKETDENEENNFRTYDAPVFGMIAENRRIVGIADAGDAKYVTIACDEEDIGYLTIAERMGEVFPLVYYGSSGLIDANTEVYDVTATRNWITERASQIFELDLLEKYGLAGLPGDVMVQSLEGREDIDDETYSKILETINEMNGATPDQAEEEEPVAQQPVQNKTQNKQKTQTTQKTESNPGARVG